MKAAFFNEHGGTDKVLYGDYSDPAVGPDDVLVRIEACGLNHVDFLLLDGRFPPRGGCRTSTVAMRPFGSRSGVSGRQVPPRASAL